MEREQELLSLRERNSSLSKENTELNIIKNQLERDFDLGIIINIF